MEEIETIHVSVSDENKIVEDKTEELSSEPGPQPANANEDAVNASRSSGLPESPWPKLNKFFLVHSSRNQNLSFECLLCRPKKSVISTYITSHSNIRKHVQVCHCKLLLISLSHAAIFGVFLC